MDLKIPRGEKKGAGGFSMVQRDLFWNSALATAGEAQLGEPLCFHFVRDWGGGVCFREEPLWGWSPAPWGSSPCPWVVWLLFGGFRGSWRLMLLGFCLFHCFLGLPPVSVETESPRRSLLTSTSSSPTFPTPLHADSECFLTVK